MLSVHSPPIPTIFPAQRSKSKIISRQRNMLYENESVPRSYGFDQENHQNEFSAPVTIPNVSIHSENFEGGSPIVASMAALILSQSPDIATSFLQEYFRNESFLPIEDNKNGDNSCRRSSELKHPTVFKERSANDLRCVNNTFACSWAAELSQISLAKSRRKSCLRGRKAEQKKNKVVQFADENGVSLVEIKEYSTSSTWNCWSVQSSNRFDSPIWPPSPPPTPTPPPPKTIKGQKRLVCEFTAPSFDFGKFYRRIDRDKVCLENVFIVDRKVTGVVKVKNEHYDKSVRARYTLDGWRSYRETEAVYICNGKSRSDHDSFTFDIDVPSSLQLHEKLEFCIKYESGGEEHWDNNEGNNYVVVNAQYFEIWQNYSPTPVRTQGEDFLNENSNCVWY